MTKNARATKQPKGTDQIRISPDSEVDTDLEYLSAWGSPKDKPDGCPACGYISEDRNGAATPPYIFDVLTPGKIDEMGSGTWTFFPEFTRHSFNMEEELSTPRAVTFISRPQELNGSPVSIHSSENREAMGR